MSEETPATNSPAPAQTTAPASAQAAVAEKPAAPEAPKEPPFNIDALLQSTSRFTRKAFNIILELRGDVPAMKTMMIRCTVEATTPETAEALQHELVGFGVKQISRNAQIISMTTDFETLQKVVKRPEVVQVDFVKI